MIFFAMFLVSLFGLGEIEVGIIRRSDGEFKGKLRFDKCVALC